MTRDSAGDAPVAVVTGASSGIGLAAATAFARLGWVVALVGRDPDRLKSSTDLVREAARGPDPVAYRCDFAALDDVRDLAAKLLAEYPRIDVLANNAGGAFTRRQVTTAGFEMSMQVNHLCHFLLANLVRERLAGGRMINTSSDVHTRGLLDPDDLSSTRRRYRTFPVYGTSKQANILFGVEAARRWPDVLTASFHPGLVRTRFGRANPLLATFFRLSPGLRTPERGADTLVWLATAPADEITTGGYYVDRRLHPTSGRLVNPDLAERLWRASADAVGLAPEPLR